MYKTENSTLLQCLQWFVHFMIAMLILYFWLYRRYRNGKKDTLPKLTENEKEEIITRWVPVPLVPNLDLQEKLEALTKLPKVEGKVEKFATIDGVEYFNMGTMNFLGFVGNARIEEVAKKTIFKYGVGSCGPRSFYGTVDVHLHLEKQLANFMGCEDAILYSYGFATISSSIPAYARRGDVIFADKGVNFAIQKGIQASRSQVKWFEHNDLADLERLLVEQMNWAKKNPKKAAKIRQFIVVEGLYAKTADLCPLPELIKLKWRYKVRIFIDESLSFATIGRSGRGVTEHYDVDRIDVDMIMVSLENAIATTGGFCVGRQFLIEHQRLSGLGYVFSASLPPLLTAAASKALEIIAEDPDRISRLQTNARMLHEALASGCKETCFDLVGIDLSPFKLITLKDEQKHHEKLGILVEKIMHGGILVVRTHYLQNEEISMPRPSIKITCSSEMTNKEMLTATQTLKLAMKNV